jgi:aspartyl-tRNA(Asn)/glutamyl-tRNA(Gln) amidotransferase subunit C
MLARLELTPEEAELFRAQLSAVLERATRIQSLDLDDVPQWTHPAELRNVLRDDVVDSERDPEAILGNAPLREGNLFRVPRILEDED